MSPAWCSPDCGPCGLPVGLKWPPVLMPSPELQSPLSWMWKPCSLPGGRPETFARTRTSLPSCVNVTEPRTLLPLAGSRLATAEACEPMCIDAQPATSAAGRSRNAFMAVPPGADLFLRRVLRLLLGLLGVGLGLLLAALGGIGLRHDRHRLRDGLALLAQVVLVILHGLVLGGG